MEISSHSGRTTFGMSRGATRVAGTAVLPVLRGVASGQPWAAAWRTPLRESTTWSRTLATNLNDDREHDRQRRGHPAVLKLGELPAEERAVPCERQWVNPDLWERVKLKRCKEVCLHSPIPTSPHRAGSTVWPYPETLPPTYVGIHLSCSEPLNHRRTIFSRRRRGRRRRVPPQWAPGLGRRWRC